MTSRTEFLTEESAPFVSHHESYADWSAILVGSVIAAGTGAVFSAFGTGVGMAVISPYDGDGSATAALLSVALWIIWTTVSSIMVGGYVAGRMRRRVSVTTADEVSVRDGIHGLAVWGVAVLIGVWLAGAATGNVASAVAGTPTEETVNSTATELDDADAARIAKNYAVIASFVTAAAMLIAAGGAYWAAGIGGRHRDESRAFARFGTWN